MGDIEIDFEQMEVAKKNAKMNVSPPETTLGRKMTIEFQGKEFHDFNIGITISLINQTAHGTIL